MTSYPHQAWTEAARETITSYRRMIDALADQLSDEELFARPTPEANSVAVLLRHLGGNLQSRWTDFLTSDGEKPDRDRDSEFEDWPGDRASLIAWFDQGWKQLENATAQMEQLDPHTKILIRGEPHTIAQALLRSLTHLTWHVGQMALTARTVHQGRWNWLTIPPGGSQNHNQSTWGSRASRSVPGEQERGDSSADS